MQKFQEALISLALIPFTQRRVTSSGLSVIPILNTFHILSIEVDNVFVKCWALILASFATPTRSRKYTFVRKESDLIINSNGMPSMACLWYAIYKFFPSTGGAGMPTPVEGGRAFLWVHRKTPVLVQLSCTVVFFDILYMLISVIISDNIYHHHMIWSIRYFKYRRYLKWKTRAY